MEYEQSPSMFLHNKIILKILNKQKKLTKFFVLLVNEIKTNTKNCAQKWQKKNKNIVNKQMYKYLQVKYTIENKKYFVIVDIYTERILVKKKIIKNVRKLNETLSYKFSEKILKINEKFQRVNETFNKY